MLPVPRRFAAGAESPEGCCPLPRVGGFRLQACGASTFADHAADNMQSE